MNRINDGAVRLFKPQLQLSSLLYLLVVAGLGSGWYFDRVQLNRRSAEIELKCDRKIERMHLGIGTYEEARTFASVYRQYQNLEQADFLRYMQSTAVLEVINLFNFKGRAYELELDDEVTDIAQRLLSLLGCSDLDAFLRNANRLGFEEDDFLLTYDPNPNELQHFYNFVEEATRN